MTDNRSCVIYALSTMPTKASMLGTCERDVVPEDAGLPGVACGRPLVRRLTAMPAVRGGRRRTCMTLLARERRAAGRAGVNAPAHERTRAGPVERGGSRVIRMGQGHTRPVYPPGP